MENYALLRILANDYEQTTLEMLQTAEARRIWRMVLSSRLNLMAELQEKGLTFSGNDWAAILKSFNQE